MGEVCYFFRTRDQVFSETLHLHNPSLLRTSAAAVWLCGFAQRWIALATGTYIGKHACYFWKQASCVNRFSVDWWDLPPKWKSLQRDRVCLGPQPLHSAIAPLLHPLKRQGHLLCPCPVTEWPRKLRSVDRAPELSTCSSASVCALHTWGSSGTRATCSRVFPACPAPCLAPGAGRRELGRFPSVASSNSRGSLRCCPLTCQQSRKLGMNRFAGHGYWVGAAKGLFGGRGPFPSVSLPLRAGDCA